MVLGIFGLGVIFFFWVVGCFFNFGLIFFGFEFKIFVFFRSFFLIVWILKVDVFFFR